VGQCRTVVELSGSAAAGIGIRRYAGRADGGNRQKRCWCLFRDGNKTLPAWLAGMGTLTFGLVAGFVVTALPFLLSARASAWIASRA